MQDGGHLDLFKRFHAREKKDWPITVPKTKSIMKQLMRAICHMHLGAKVVHRDIKPENIIMNEMKSDVMVYVCDFDTARIMPKKHYCRGMCGTFPFMAPEVVLEDMYDPFAADIWSMAMVFLELACCLSVLRKALGLSPHEKGDSRQERARKEKAMTGKIYECFREAKSSHALIDWYVRKDLQSLKDYMTVLSDGMLNVHFRQRWTDEKVQEVSDELVTSSNSSSEETSALKELSSDPDRTSHQLPLLRLGSRVRPGNSTQTSNDCVAYDSAPSFLFGFP
jgi:serine/threonine protein kinase